MAGDGADIKETFNILRSHAMSSGWFDLVNGHEPKSPPGNGLTAAVWIQDIYPVRTSGLSMTSARVIYLVRIYANMMQDPEDAIDPNLADAAMYLMGQYSRDFELGDEAREIDLLGASGESLHAEAGYLEMDKSTTFRVMTIKVPVIYNDVWEQSP